MVPIPLYLPDDDEKVFQKESRDLSFDADLLLVEASN